MKSKDAQKRFPQGFQSHRISVLGVSVKLINIDDVPKVLRIVGTEESENLTDVLAGLSLQQLFCDAFGEKFEAAERQAYLRKRDLTIEKRNEWTDSIKLYGQTHEVPENWKENIYRNTSDRLNLALTGQKARFWVEKFGCHSGALRDQWNFRLLSNIESIEKHATILVLRGREPMDALNAAIEFFDYEVDPAPQKTVSAAAEYKRKRRAAGLAN
jgi:hypothetical protein